MSRQHSCQACCDFCVVSSHLWAVSLFARSCPLYSVNNACQQWNVCTLSKINDKIKTDQNNCYLVSKYLPRALHVYLIFLFNTIWLYFLELSNCMWYPGGLLAVYMMGRSDVPYVSDVRFWVENFTPSIFLWVKRICHAFCKVLKSVWLNKSVLRY